jgi:hypothetical protein
VLPVSDMMLGKKLELALLRKSMSGSAGSCSPEQLRPDRQALGSAVDSTLSDHGSHGERAHFRRSVFLGERAHCWLRRYITGVLARHNLRSALHLMHHFPEDLRTVPYGILNCPRRQPNAVIGEGTPVSIIV